MNKKIVFFDIDGTLLDHGKRIPSSTIEAIQKLKQNNIYVAIATGRAPFMFEAIREKLGIESFVSFNGQYVVFEGRTIYNNALSHDALVNLYNKSMDHNYPMVFMNEKEMRASVDKHPYIRESFESLQFHYPDVDPYFFHNNHIYQALLFCEEGQENQFVKSADAFDFIRWHHYSCDVLPGGGSKAIGMEKIIEASGLDIGDSYGFGDGLNDIEMIRETGTGVVMGNGVRELKEVADYITDDVANDGIAKALEQLKLI
ncbi:Cof subfamily protein (haloacid dehalogenase superfamily) [Virgibacillus natechei]|uniref:Cof subfamily protein (Haloacid dehalogenase superfamily) n=1 Tax=Virgibacillus natechei TaxID=1216297 RepID=A0ABS4IBE9_9BACI|nr:Cof-type HAD-IIB family hydrolase [Virgibacillus natechei]MBP1968252.1 Cof subfamily protein (haloacid dehalogenase superfamily) [Virgibacillus natechei]UZD14479.1 Cof-type HAD-IIB family hydrolase [Virgibacillus natechei]